MEWHFTSEGNGGFVTIYAPDGRTAFLQGQDADRFMERTRYPGATAAELCMDYADCLERPEQWAAPLCERLANEGAALIRAGSSRS